MGLLVCLFARACAIRTRRSAARSEWICCTSLTGSTPIGMHIAVGRPGLTSVAASAELRTISSPLRDAGVVSITCLVIR